MEIPFAELVPRPQRVVQHGLRSELSSTAIERLSSKAQVINRRAYCLPIYEGMKRSRYHTVRLRPEPECAHRIC